MSQNKSYYAVIPASVRYHPGLCSSAKLLYGELTALSNEMGYCWASNSYFSKLYDTHKNTVSKWFSNLAENGFIKIEVTKNENGCDRKVYIAGDQKCLTPVESEAPASPKKNGVGEEQRAMLKKVVDRWNSKTGFYRHRDSYIDNGHSGQSKFSTLALNIIEEDGLEHLLKTIDLYDEIVNNTDYYWQHRYTLADFLRRGYERFSDEKIARMTFKSNGYGKSRGEKSEFSGGEW